MILSPITRLCLLSGRYALATQNPIILGGNIFRPPFVTNRTNGHQPTCPVANVDGCVDTSSSNGSKIVATPFKRAIYGGKVRMGFIPDEWYTFFHGVTGQTGFFFLMLGVTNYCVSKEIYVMEHEYYTGLSIFLMVYYASTRFGPQLGKTLDKEVDAYIESWEKDRKDEKAMNETIIQEAAMAQVRANGQKLLMDAKKENVAMQLEAVFRERSMHVYRMVKARLDYHLRRYQSERRIHQKWMHQWIMKNVKESIDEAFEKQALNQAIQEIERMASRA